MKKPTLYSAYYTTEDPFGIFGKTVSVLRPKEMDTDGVLILWGGEDISPSIYRQAPVHTHAPPQPSRRDVVEMALYDSAVERGIPIIGVCRGAQLAVSLAGGSLYQHIKDGHHSNHKVVTYDGNEYMTSSCHHQALNLDAVKHELLAWDKDRKTTAYTDKDEREIVVPEVAYLINHNVFCIQGHPEWMSPESPFVKWCSSEIKKRFQCFHSQ